jgi:hypothetical protein
VHDLTSQGRVLTFDSQLRESGLLTTSLDELPPAVLDTVLLQIIAQATA